MSVHPVRHPQDPGRWQIAVPSPGLAAHTFVGNYASEGETWTAILAGEHRRPEGMQLDLFVFTRHGRAHGTERHGQ